MFNENDGGKYTVDHLPFFNAALQPTQRHDVLKSENNGTILSHSSEPNEDHHLPRFKRNHGFTVSTQHPTASRTFAIIAPSQAVSPPVVGKSNFNFHYLNTQIHPLWLTFVGERDLETTYNVVRNTTDLKQRKRLAILCGFCMYHLYLY
jgi:hypothetical protein